VLPDGAVVVMYWSGRPLATFAIFKGGPNSSARWVDRPDASGRGPGCICSPVQVESSRDPRECMSADEPAAPRPLIPPAGFSPSTRTPYEPRVDGKLGGAWPAFVCLDSNPESFLRSCSTPAECPHESLEFVWSKNWPHPPWGRDNLPHATAIAIHPGRTSGVRDRTASRNHCPARGEFRREHARRRECGLVRRTPSDYAASAVSPGVSDSTCRPPRAALSRRHGQQPIRRHRGRRRTNPARRRSHLSD
jgi:hypothetical protein